MGVARDGCLRLSYFLFCPGDGVDARLAEDSISNAPGDFLPLVFHDIFYGFLCEAFLPFENEKKDSKKE
jgi:hypothetical protein